MPCSDCSTDMRSLILSLTLLLPLLVGAQGFGSFSHDQPFLAKDAAGGGGGGDFDGSIESIPGIQHYWIYTNGVTTDAPEHTPPRITNWASSVSSAVWDKVGATFTKWPTNITATGVYFDGWSAGQYLGGGFSDIVTNQSISVFCVLQPKRFAYATVPIIYGSSSSSLWMQNGNSNLIAYARNFGGSGPSTVQVGYIGSILRDFVVIMSNSPSGGGVIGYIDGVLKTNSPNESLTNLHLVNDGLSFGASGYYDGTITTIAIFTNGISPVNVSNLHWWRTNIYGGSP